MKFVNIVLAFVLALGGMVLGATAASAHHPLVTGVTVCDTKTGLSDINWTVRSDDPNRGKEWKINTAKVNGKPLNSIQTGSFKPESQNYTGVTSQVGPGTYTLVVKASWKPKGPNNVKNSNSVTVGDTCERDKPEKPSKDNLVVKTEGQPNCDTRTVDVITTTTVYTYTFDEKKWEWVESSETTSVTTTREATVEECPPVVPEKPEPIVTEASSQSKDCDSRTVTTVTTVTTTDWVLVDNVWVKGEPVTVETSATRDMTVNEVGECLVAPPTTEPPVVNPPTTNPPVVVNTPAATTPPAARAARTGELAYTGGNGWALGITALALVLGGAILVAARKFRLPTRKH